MTDTQEMELFQAILVRLKMLNSKVQVKAKRAVWLHKAINFILNLVYPRESQDAYLKKYNTTLGYTIAMAEHQGTDPTKFRNWTTLCHEGEHAEQAKRWTRVLFGYLYLWPLSQGILLALFCWVPLFWASGWWTIPWIVGWLAIAGLHFIPRIPDPWRARWELQAYTISMHLHYLVHRKIEDEYIDQLVENFSSMMYYVMEPRREKIRKRLKDISNEIYRGKSPVKDNKIVKIAEEEYKRIA